jgi:phosphatidylglycerophosphatase A
MAALGEPKLPPSEARARLASLDALSRWSLTAGGLGFARFAPGTWGSLPPCVAVLVLCAVLPAGLGWVLQAVIGAFLVFACFGCVRWGARAEEALGLKDPSCVVLDEVAGMAIALFLLRWPLRSESEGWGWLWTACAGIAMAFVLFRAFDVLKPPPCRGLQGVKGGTGILLDDVFAGIYASVVMHLVGPLAG